VAETPHKIWPVFRGQGKQQFELFNQKIEALKNLMISGRRNRNG